MYYLLNRDKDILYKLYNDVLNDIVRDIINNEINDLNGIIGYIHSLFDIYISDSDNITPFICDIPSDGIYALLGSNKCRFKNIFLYDLLIKLNYNVDKQYINVDDRTWYRLDNVDGANHIVVKLIYNNEELYLDLANRIYFNDKLKFMSINKYNNKININNDRINILDDIIEFYRVHERLGVEHIYEYSIH